MALLPEAEHMHKLLELKFSVCSSSATSRILMQPGKGSSPIKYKSKLSGFRINNHNKGAEIIFLTVLSDIQDWHLLQLLERCTPK
jgi:hypothetical protein